MNSANPNLRPCPDCGRGISKRAAFCPGCGCPRPGQSAGWKILLSILVITAILGIIAAIAIPAFVRAKIKAQQARARADLMSFKMAIAAYYMDTRISPKSLRDLVRKPSGASHWNGPYIRNLPRDPWGRSYIYRVDGKGGYELLSYGADGREGGIGANADIVLRRK